MFSEYLWSFITAKYTDLYTDCVSIQIDRLVLKKNKENDKSKSSLTIIEKGIPWSDDMNKRKPKHHNDQFTAEKQHLNVTASSLGFPSRGQAPSSSVSTMSNSASSRSHVAFSSHSTVLVSPSVEASSISNTGLPRSISPSVAPTMPAKPRSPPPSPKVPRTKATTETKFDSTTKEPNTQGDKGNAPGRHTRKTDQNITITTDSLKQRATSSVSPSAHVSTSDIVEKALGMIDGYTSTEFIQHHTSSGKEIDF